MSDSRSRRAFLATVGAVTLGGCVSDTSDTGAGGTPTDEATDTRTSTPQITGPSPTESRTATDTETESPTESDSSGPTPPSSVDGEWPMPAADAGLSNAAARSSGPTERVSRLWQVTAETTFSAPVVADGTLYVGGDDGTVRALDARTGERQWQWSGDAAAGAPWVVGDRLFVPAADAIVALERDRGRKSWRVETPDRAATLAADHGVYWLDRSEPAVVAIAREDGSQRWRTSIAEPWEPPLFAGDGQVFVSSGTHDNRFWRLSVEDGEVLNEKPRSGNDFPAEQCYADGTVYAVDPFFGNVRANPVDGGDGWSAGVPPGGRDPGGSVSVGTDRVYYVSTMSEKPGLTALSTADGTQAWTADVTATITGRPVVAGDVVLVPTDGGLRSFDPADGSKRWTHGDIGSRFVVADDLVYAAGDGAVRAFRPPAK